MASERQDRQKAPSVGSWQWSGFNRRRGTGPEPFEQRLARARLLFLRRREVAANWLALAVALSLYAILGCAVTAHATPLDDVDDALLLDTCFPFDAVDRCGPLPFETTAIPEGRRNARDAPKEIAVATATSKVMS